LNKNDVLFFVPARRPVSTKIAFLGHSLGYVRQALAAVGLSTSYSLRILTMLSAGLSRSFHRMAAERPVDLALLLTKAFSASVRELNVEVGLYTFDLMHMDQISGGARWRRLLGKRTGGQVRPIPSQ
jgi:hypothetical protein